MAVISSHLICRVLLGSTKCCMIIPVCRAGGSTIKTADKTLNMYNYKRIKELLRAFECNGISLEAAQQYCHYYSNKINVQRAVKMKKKKKKALNSYQVLFT